MVSKPAWPTEVGAAQALPVLFANSRAAARAASVTGPAVAIVPDTSSFNNFGRLFWSELYIIGDGQSLDSISVMLMFEGRASTRPYLEELFAKLDRQWARAEETTLPFVTVMNNESGYATFVRRLGFEVAVATLRGMGDAVVLEVDAADSRVAMISSVDFHEGALRTPETYYAYRNGERHLTPYPPVAAQDARGFFRFAAQLPGVAEPTPVAIDLAPDDLFRDRLAVLIGRNGVGKSQLVQSLIEGLRRHPQSRGQTPASGAEIEALPAFSRLIVLSSVASDMYPRDIPAWSGLDYTYASLVHQPDEGARRLLWILIDCFRAPGKKSFLFDGQPIDRFGLLKLLLGRFGFWEDLAVPLREPPPLTSDIFPMAEMIGDQRYVRLTQLAGEQRSVRVGVLITPEKPVGVLTQDGQVRQLSSGETAMLRFAVLAVSTIESASVLVLEEPETYLHPNYVSQMMAILHDLLVATSSVAIIVTHSAYVVRETTRQRVNVLKRDLAGTPWFAVTPIQTFGASVDSISQFVFGDGLVSPQFRQTLRRWVAANPDLTVDRLKERYAAEFTPETLSFVADLIEGVVTQPEA